MYHAGLQKQSEQKSDEISIIKSVSMKQMPSVKNILQTKLRVGAPNDRYEREADKVADAFVSGTQQSLSTSTN